MDVEAFILLCISHTMNPIQSTPNIREVQAGFFSKHSWPIYVTCLKYSYWLTARFILAQSFHLESPCINNAEHKKPHTNYKSLKSWEMDAVCAILDEIQHRLKVQNDTSAPEA